MKSKSVFWALLIAQAYSLTACVSTAVSGAEMVYNRYSIQQKISNQYASMRAYQKIYLDSQRYKDTHVEVITTDDSVLLVGQVPDRPRQLEIAGLISSLMGARKIYNYIETAAPSSTLTRASDSWITAKIKSQLLVTSKIDATRIKVVTENGNVYLIGMVPHDQADFAVLIAQNTQGVQSVIKMFTYLYTSRV